MLRSLKPLVLSLSLGLVLCLPANGQSQPPLGDVARKSKAAKSAAPDKAAKVITNETLDGQGACATPAQSTKDATPEDASRSAFLRRIGGRWNLAYFRKGNQRWWPDHGTAQPKNKTHYLIGPAELLVESRPEFSPPSITTRFAYGSVRKISADLFDLALHKPCEPASEEIKRFKLSADGKTLEIVTDAAGSPEPIVQVMELVDSNWSSGANQH